MSVMAHGPRLVCHIRVEHVQIYCFILSTFLFIYRLEDVIKLDLFQRDVE